MWCARPCRASTAGFVGEFILASSCARDRVRLASAGAPGRGADQLSADAMEPRPCRRVAQLTGSGARAVDHLRPASLSTANVSRTSKTAQLPRKAMAQRKSAPPQNRLPSLLQSCTMNRSVQTPQCRCRACASEHQRGWRLCLITGASSGARAGTGAALLPPSGLHALALRWPGARGTSRPGRGRSNRRRQRATASTALMWRRQTASCRPGMRAWRSKACLTVIANAGISIGMDTSDAADLQSHGAHILPPTTRAWLPFHPLFRRRSERGRPPGRHCQRSGHTRSARARRLLRQQGGSHRLLRVCVASCVPAVCAWSPSCARLC